MLGCPCGEQGARLGVVSGEVVDGQRAVLVQTRLQLVVPFEVYFKCAGF